MVATEGSNLREGLHKRRAHSHLRNEELLGPLPRAEQHPTALRPSIWSVEEVSILEQYEKVYAGDLHMNMKIATHLPFKTNKQVSNYRMERRKKSNRMTTGVGQQGLVPNDGTGNVPTEGLSSPLLEEGSDAAGGGLLGIASNSLESSAIEGLSPAGQVAALHEGESSLLASEPESCFRLNPFPLDRM
jgi:hypothetical protein